MVLIELLYIKKDNRIVQNDPVSPGEKLTVVLTAYNDELYDSVMYGLSEFFTSNFDERQVKVGDKVSYRTYIRIRDFKNVVREFLSETKIPSYYDVLEYWGRYEGVLKELMDRGVYEKIDFRIPDYPDYGKVIEYVNDGFRDNI